jgi:hypothetical protein
MNKQSVYVSQMPAGCERAGATKGTEQAMMMPAYILPGTELAPPSGIAYHHRNQCTAFNKHGEQCEGNKIAGEEICLAHVRQRTKREKEVKQKELLKEVIITSE